MNFFVRTYNQQVRLELDIKTFGNEITVIGSDPGKKNTQYFNRSILEDDIYIFNLPQSPKVLKIDVFEVKEGDIPVSQRYEIVNFSMKTMEKKPLIVDAETIEFIEFASQFAKNCGYSYPGTYRSKNGRFLINFYATIDQNDDTPSRIHKINNEIDVSKKWFDQMTIPGRMAILLHEFAHNYLDSGLNDNHNDRIEKEADANALEIYLALGYPKIEWMYAWETIFIDNEKHLERLAYSDFNLRNSL